MYVCPPDDGQRNHQCIHLRCPALLCIKSQITPKLSNCRVQLLISYLPFVNFTIAQQNWCNKVCPTWFHFYLRTVIILTYTPTSRHAHIKQLCIMTTDGQDMVSSKYWALGFKNGSRYRNFCELRRLVLLTIMTACLPVYLPITGLRLFYTKYGKIVKRLQYSLPKNSVTAVHIVSFLRY